MNYLKTPLDFSNIIKGKSSGLSYCKVEESIAQHLLIILTSKPGEVIGKPDYSSEIWDLEFNQLVKINKWEQKVQESLHLAVQKYETRLKGITVKVRLSEIDNDSESADIHVRRKAEVKIFGTIIGSDLPFSFATLLYISPLSQ